MATKKRPEIRNKRPTLEAYTAYAPMFKDIIKSGILTNGEHVRLLESKVARYLGVKHCVAVSSCSSGLMLVMKGLGLTGEVILPSFTFSASVNPVLWNGLTPVFADIDPDTYTLDHRSVEKLITPRTSAIVATHVFGVPCDVEALQAIADRHDIRLIYDAAHAFGSTVGKVKVGGFGNAEVFSCSPIKLLTTAEGGIVATNDDTLAEFCRHGRNYGDDGTYDTRFSGLSARMSEFHAALGLVSLAHLPQHLKARSEKARYLISAFKKITPQLAFQSVPSGVKTNYYDLSIRIDPAIMYFTRDDLYEFFKANGIATRKYFYPPLHEQRAYNHIETAVDLLPITRRVAQHVLSLPLFSHISQTEMDRIINTYKEFITRNKRHTV